MGKTFYTKNSDETIKLGEKFAKTIKNGAIITLYGNLGAGKTTFVQGIAKGLGIKRRITSPTFILVREYNVTDNQKFFHIDLYRMESEKDVEELGISELFEDTNNIIAIEWPEKINNLPKNKTDIFFEYMGDNRRKIIVKNYE